MTDKDRKTDLNRPGSPGRWSYLDTHQTLASPGKYLIHQLAFIAEMLSVMFSCIISPYDRTIFPWKQANTLPIEACSVSILRHVSATFGHIALGLMANSEAVHRGVHGRSCWLKTVAIYGMLPPGECQIIPS
jgi:hypothetical protein